MHLNTKPLLALFLATTLATARQEVQVCGTHPDKSQEEVALHRAHRLRMAAGTAMLSRRQASTRSVARDIGNIAVLEDADGVVARRNAFNLDRKLIRFVPSTANAARYRFEISEGGYDSALADRGTPVAGLGDDDTREITLPFSFPFYGQTFTRLFLNSDGNLTFRVGDTSISERSIGRATSGPARIAGLFDDLDPSRTSTGVRVLADASQFVVSWVNVPEFTPSGSGARQTFQIRLYRDGRIEFAYNGIGATGAVVGISPGSLQGVSSVVAFLGGNSQEYSGAILERFTTSEEIDIVFAAQKFYETHEDTYDFLVIYNTMNIDAAAGAVAFESTVRSSHLGIGDVIVDDGPFYGSARRLQAVLNLGPLSQYPRDPNGTVSSRSSSRDTPLTIIGHEAGHLWLALASVREPANAESRPMLGRQSAHWAFTFNSEASLLEGNRIQDDGPGASPRFRTVAVTEGYAPLDQYLMGLRAPEEVPTTFFVANPSIGTGPRGPQVGVSFDGNRRDVPIQELIEAEGRRTPDHTVAQRRFRMAFLLVTQAGVDPSAENLEKVEDYRQRFEEFFNRASGGRAFAETALKRNLQLSVEPASGVVAGSSATAWVSLARPSDTPLTLMLRTQTGAASVPASVTIGAGQMQASFPIRGERAGVEELSAEPSDSRFATAHARIQVAESAAALLLAPIAGDKQTVVSGSRLPQAIRVRVVDRNSLPYPGLTVNAAVTAGGTVTPASAESDAEGFVSFQWTPGGGQLHELRATLASNPGSTLLFTALGRPTLAAAGVVNAASFTTGLSPGGLGTIFGLNLAAGATGVAQRVPLSTEMSGVRVLINGRAVGLLFLSDRQINFVAPPDLATGDAEIVVTIGSPSAPDATPAVRVPVRAVDPGIFFQAGTGLGAILVGGTGKTTIERAAYEGDVLEIYCTGLGALRPNPQNGLTETVARPRVLVGGREADVLFSGSAPGFPGLYQVNARVPGGLAAGSQPLTMLVDGPASNEVQVVVGRAN